MGFRGKIGRTGGLLVLFSALLQTSAIGSEDDAGVPELSSREGLLVVDLLVERRVSTLDFKQQGRRWTHRLGPVEAGRVLKVVRVRAGQYQWWEISLPHYDLPFRKMVSEDERWSFHVEPEAVNYVGQIIVDERRGTDYADVRLVNRIAMNFPEIQEKLKPYLERYPLVYTGAGRDDFYREYRKLLSEDKEGGPD